MSGGGPLIFIVAGEPSGDALGARLMAALKERTQGAVRFAGIGGERMIGEGLDSLLPMRELSVMGYLEVVPKLPRILGHIRTASEAARRFLPAALVTIDSPEFSLRVQRRLADAGIAQIHYVAPQVWAHRPARAARIARYLDHVLALLPFEPPYFEAVGLPCSFVGHGVVEEGADQGDGPAFRSRHGIPTEAPVVCVLPGSRLGEVTRHVSVFGETIALLARRVPGLHVVVPAFAAVEAEVATATADWRAPTTVVNGRDEKYDAFAASNAALAVSGTVALELAIAGVPMAIAYRGNPLSIWLAKRMSSLSYICLVNLILDRPVVPEFIQQACRADTLADAMVRLLSDEKASREQRTQARRAAELIGLGGPAPSVRAAEIILEVIANKRAASA